MNPHRHYISGIFQRRFEALIAIAHLKNIGLPLKRMQIIANKGSMQKSSDQAQSNEVLKNIVVKASAGAVIGMGIGALTQIVLVATNLTLFFASPLIAPLAMLGWGATVGATVGAVIGSIKRGQIQSNNQGWFSDLISEAIANGQVVLVVETFSKKETELAGGVIKQSANNYKEVHAAKLEF
jgi:tetrahydromethanopterin S-methyltransferase subunit E